MKIYLEFDDNNEDDMNKHRYMMQGPNATMVLSDIGQEIFRPARKHGYNNKELNDLVNKNEDSREIIEMLEKMFYEILERYEVKLG